AERPQGERPSRNRRRNRNNRGGGQGAPFAGPRQGGNHGPNPGKPRHAATREFGFDDDDDRDLEHLPRHIDPLQTNLHGRRNTPRGPSHGAVGQPDPMRTSIDLMGKSGGGGGRNKRNRRSGGGFNR
ncbi:MAG: RNA helicase, partial [Pseudomonadota bacterium]|nr:RNA helicase [Pseudomonadota bacterium]